MGSETVNVEVYELAQDPQIEEVEEEQPEEVKKEEDEDKKPIEEGQAESYIIEEGEEEKKEEPVLDLVLAEPKSDQPEESLKSQYEERFIE